MRFVYLLLIFSLVVNGGQSQQVQKLWVPSWPGIASNTSTFIPPGTFNFKTVIQNKSAHSVLLYPYLNRAGLEQIALSDSLLLAYLQSQIQGITDTDEIRLKLVQLVGTKIEKTDLFNHGQVIYGPGDSNLYSKQNSLIGALSGTLQKQCSNYVQNAIEILVKTGYFDYTNIQIVNLVNHEPCQFIYRGQWVYVDFDPQEPFFMVADSNNSSGFASTIDIFNNRNLISADKAYLYVNDAGDSVNIASPNITLQKYRNRFASVSFMDVPYTNGPLSISGVICLPAQATLTTEYSNPYILDSASLALFLNEFSTGDWQDVYSTLSQILNVSYDSAINIINQRNLSANPISNTWHPDYAGITPTVKIVLPANDDTVRVQVSQSNGINFPGYILGSSIALNLHDTIFQPSQSPQLWLSSDSNENVVPHPSDGSVQYLANNGFIPPHPNGSDSVLVSFNPRIINFYSGFNLGYLPGDSIITTVYINGAIVSSDSTYSDTLIQTGLFTHVNNFDINVYPNPVKNELNIDCGYQANLTASLFDISGKVVEQINILQGPNIFSLKKVENGIYFLFVNNNTQVNGLYKIVVMH